MNEVKYTEDWEATAQAEPEYEEFADYKEVYTEIAAFLSDGIRRKVLPANVAVNMCFSLLINQLIKSGVCPACEFHQASETIHEKRGCPDVH